jgi:multisubunit Na+/H+ antiporter MnhB subunit
VRKKQEELKNMNEKQKLAVIVAGVVMCLMLLYPPFYFDAGERIINAGYGIIFSPPWDGANVNISVLLVQWIAVAVGGGVAWLILKGKQ